ncbi:MAG: hypothetical protein ACYTBJ_01915 [Planctomycetota bacterium]|jgi:hypothetical protein
MNIDLLIPTCERPTRLRALLQSLQNHTTKIAQLCAAVYVDDNDALTLSQLPALLRDFPFMKAFIYPPIDNGGDRWNALVKVTNGAIIGMGADDVIYQTPGWDDKVRAAFEAIPDRIALVHGRDGINGPEKVTLGFVSRKSTEILGYYLPSHFRMLWVDTWLEEIYNAIGRRVLIPDLMTRHLHFSVHPETWDETYAKWRGPGEHERQRGIWDATKDERIRDAERLRKALAA